MFIVKIGNNFEGYVHYGPFESFAEAHKWKMRRMERDSARGSKWNYDIVELFSEAA